MKNLAGKYCVVTGAGKGIGKAIAKRFLEEEAAGVAIWEYDPALAEATARELDPDGRKVIVVRCNVADSDQVKQATEETVAAFGRIDVLVNNAGITRDRIFHKMTDDEWHAVIDVNLNGVYNTCKFVVPMMREQMSGSIINISSTSLSSSNAALRTRAFPAATVASPAVFATPNAVAVPLFPATSNRPSGSCALAAPLNPSLKSKLISLSFANGYLARINPTVS
jgi:3-oxoacyl-[acyl-carrier protein] reductase